MQIEELKRGNFKTQIKIEELKRYLGIRSHTNDLKCYKIKSQFRNKLAFCFSGIYKLSYLNC
jgi:hypothetical protein